MAKLTNESPSRAEQAIEAFQEADRIDAKPRVGFGDDTVFKLDAEYARTRAYELLSWLAGRSSRERAEMFGIPKATVKTRTIARSPRWSRSPGRYPPDIFVKELSMKRQPIRRPVQATKRGRRPRPPMPVIPKTLTDKQRRFVEEYCLDLCATQAAIRAGYSRRSAKEQGYENLTQPHIKAAIADWQARKASRVETTWQEIHDELRKLAFANLLDYFEIDKDGKPRIDLSMITRAQGAALTSLVVVDSTAKTPGRVEIKLAEKRQAAMDLAKLLGYVQDRVKLEGSIDLIARTAKIAEDVRAMTDEELVEYDALERRQESMLALARARHQAQPALPAHVEVLDVDVTAPPDIEAPRPDVDVAAVSREGCTRSEVQPPRPMYYEP